jgi:general secretion pathway protein H
MGRKVVKKPMPTLATGTWDSKPRDPARNPISARMRRAVSTGFTLIEIMIVVFIIGLVTAIAVVTFGGDSRDTELDKEAERLDALMDYAREQAELQTRDFGFRMNRNSYQFVVFDPLRNEWRLATEDDALRERAIPEGLLPGLVVEGRPVVLDTKWPKIDDFKPQVMIFGNGDLSSFEVSLERESSRDRAQISSDEQSVIRMQLPGEEEAVASAVRNAPPPSP